MLWALLKSEDGVYRRDEKGEDTGKSVYAGSEEARNKLWEHTVQEVKAATNTEAQG